MTVMCSSCQKTRSLEPQESPGPDATDITCLLPQRDLRDSIIQLTYKQGSEAQARRKPRLDPGKGHSILVICADGRDIWPQLLTCLPSRSKEVGSTSLPWNVSGLVKSEQQEFGVVIPWQAF